MPANNHNAAVAPSQVIATASATNASAVATAAAPGTSQKWVVTGYDVSCSAAPAAAVAFTITRTLNGITETLTQGVPAAAFALTGRNFPDGGLDCDANTAVVATLPSFGVGVTGYVNVYGRRVAVG